MAETGSLCSAFQDLRGGAHLAAGILPRATETCGLARTLNQENIAGGPFESLSWNIANWNRTAGGGRTAGGVRHAQARRIWPIGSPCMVQAGVSDGTLCGPLKTSSGSYLAFTRDRRARFSPW